MKKVVLTYPNQRWLKDDPNTTWNLNPVTLCILGAVIRDIAEVIIVDAQIEDLDVDDFKRRIEEISPDVVGISLITSEYQDILDITARVVKEANPATVEVAGGGHITTRHAIVLKNEDIDFGVIGEGEYVFRDLLLHLFDGAPMPTRGLAYLKDGKVIAQERVLVEDLGKLPWPAYDLVDFHRYLDREARFGPQRPPSLPALRIGVTRGCPFDCIFCQVESISGKNVRHRNVTDVVDELLFLKREYGIRSIVFEDDNMLMADKGRFAKALFREMIDRKLNLQWIAIAFALFLLDDEILDLMEKSGCVGVNVAIESGSKRVLKKIIKKPIKDLEKVPAIIEKIKARGITCLANFIVGFPGETWEEIRETIRFAERSGADYVKFFVAVPLYNTRLYNMAQSMNLLATNDEYMKIDWRHCQISSPEWTARDILILRAYEWDRINFTEDKIERMAEIWGVSVEELATIRKRTRDALVLS